MGTLKNITDEAKDVPLLSRTVDPGETVEVADAILTDDALVWPAGVWEVNGAPHEHDANAPDTRRTKAAAKRAAAEATNQGEPIVAAPGANPAPADEVTE